MKTLRASSYRNCTLKRMTFSASLGLITYPSWWLSIYLRTKLKSLKALSLSNLSAFWTFPSTVFIRCCSWDTSSTCLSWLNWTSATTLSKRESTSDCKHYSISLSYVLLMEQLSMLKRRSRLRTCTELMFKTVRLSSKLCFLKRTLLTGVSTVTKRLRTKVRTMMNLNTHPRSPQGTISPCLWLAMLMEVPQSIL